jgi:rhodanese-related sulfurtransferase
MARKLRGKGYTKVYALEGGWTEWKNSDYPLEKK